MCERGRGAVEWGGLSLAVTWNSCFSAARWRWILAHFLPVPPLYLCCQFTVFGGLKSHSFPGERRKINATTAINHLRCRIVAHKRSQSCKCLLLLSFFSFFPCRETLARARALLRKIAPSGWRCGSEVAVLTLQVWHWVEILSLRVLLEEMDLRFHHRSPPDWNHKNRFIIGQTDGQIDR